MNTDPTQSTLHPRSFILRLVVDAHGDLRGQISEPGSADEWRTTFAGPDEFWAMVLERLGEFHQSIPLSPREIGCSEKITMPA